MATEGAVWTPAHYQAFILWLTDGAPRRWRINNPGGPVIVQCGIELYHDWVYGERIDHVVLTLGLACKALYGLFDKWRLPLYAHCGRFVLYDGVQRFTFCQTEVERRVWPEGKTAYITHTHWKLGRGRATPVVVMANKTAWTLPSGVVRWNVDKAMVGDVAWDDEEPTPSATLAPT